MKIDMDEDLVDSLRRIGLNRYESKAYLALLDSSPLSASELSEKTDIPRPRTYDTLKSLEDKGVCSMQPGRPIKYKAKNVREALENLKDQKRDEHEKKIEKIDQVQEKLEEKLEEAQIEEGKDPDSYMWFLKDRGKIDSKIRSLLAKAENEVVIATDSKDATEHLSRHGEHLEKAKDRGVDVKVITDDSNEVEKQAKFAEIQEKNHKNRFMSIDDHSILFLTPGEKEEVGAWVKSPFLTQGLKHSVLE